MRLQFPIKVILTLLLFSNGLFAQNLLTNGSLERPDGVNSLYDELPAGSTAIPGWTVGPVGGIDGIRFYWPASKGRDSVDLRHGVLGPGSIFQDVLLTNRVHYRLSFDMAHNPDRGLPPTMSVSIGSVTNTFTRNAGSPFWQRRSLDFTATNTGIVRLSFADNGMSQSADPEPALDNIVLEVVPIKVTLRVSQVELCWNSVTNQLYQLQGRSDASSNSWFAVGAPVMGTGGTNCLTDAVGPTEPRRIYRVVEVP